MACLSSHQDRANGLFRRDAKSYGSEMMPFDAYSEAPSWQNLKSYESEKASFSLCSANVLAENIVQC
jgi:hypothetical protein